MDPKIDQNMWPALSAHAYKSDPADETVFTDSRMLKLEADFELPPEHRTTIQNVLEKIAIRWKNETRLAKIDRPAVRVELGAILAPVEQLAANLADASDDCLTMVGEGDFAIRLNDGDVDAEPLDVVALIASLGTLKRKLEATLQLAGEGKPGPRPDDAAFDFCLGVYLIWTWILGREFRLDWTDDSQPLTDAAQFCVSAAGCLDGGMPANRIAGAARKAREIGIPIKDLEQLPEVLDHYSKHIR